MELWAVWADGAPEAAVLRRQMNAVQAAVCPARLQGNSAQGKTAQHSSAQLRAAQGSSGQLSTGPAAQRGAGQRGAGPLCAWSQLRAAGV